MTRANANRETTLTAKEAALKAAIAKQQRALHKVRHQQRVRAEEVRRMRCYALGEEVMLAGLADVAPQELQLALVQVARFATDRVAWGHFLHGDITQEWIGPGRTVESVETSRETYATA